MPVDRSAFWLYPDWNGPLKEPFWMRPLALPPEPAPTGPNDSHGVYTKGRGYVISAR